MHIKESLHERDESKQIFLLMSVSVYPYLYLFTSISTLCVRKKLREKDVVNIEMIESDSIS